MVKYLVTTRPEVLNHIAVNGGYQVFMIDGTVPGYEMRPIDHKFDHHKQGGSDIQIDEMPRLTEHPLTCILGESDFEPLIVTTQVDADACVAAAWLLLTKKDLFGNEIGIAIANQRKDQVIRALRAIAYDCDHLTVPPELDEYADFAAQCVAAMKADSDKLVEELGLPRDRKQWSIEQKEEFASFAFKSGTESLIAACKGEREFPGVRGEAAAYWEQVESNVRMILAEDRISIHRNCLIFNAKGLGGKYIDPRCWLKATKILAERNDSYNVMRPITLVQREVFVNNEFKGFSYTIGCIPLHPKLVALDFTKGAFENLTKAERQLNPKADGWGGRKTVGGSGWNTPSQLAPETVIDIVLGDPF